MKRFDFGRIITVARWEFIRTIKSPTFLVLTIVVPLIILLSGGLSVITSRVAETESLDIAVRDELGDFYGYLDAELVGSPLPSGVNVFEFTDDADSAERELRAGSFDAMLTVNSDAVAEGSISAITGDRQEARINVISGPLSRAVTAYRLGGLGLSSGEIASATGSVSIEARALDQEDVNGWIGEMLVPTAVAMVLIFSAVFSGQIMMYGVIKEKRNRVVEILLSSVSALDLLIGKLIGFGGLGLLQIAVWVGIGLLVAGRFFDLSGVTPSLGDGLIYLAYFVLGYLLLASMFAALGATMKDAEGGGQVQGLVVLVPMVPVFLAGPLVASPNATWARLISHIPPFIPSSVLLRMAGTNLPTWEIVSTLTILALSVMGFIYLSARIFEGGILRFERATTLREAARMATGNGDR